MNEETPMLMCSEMVRAILDGRKMQTRRIIKPQPWYDKGYWFYEYKKGCSHYIGDTHPTEHWALENMFPYCPCFFQLFPLASLLLLAVLIIVL